MFEWSDQDFLRIAYMAAFQSPDPSNQNGAVLVHEGYPVCADCNRFPDGLEVTPDMLTDREKKLFYIEHAERNAIFKAARCRLPFEEMTLYCQWFACADCARAIIQSGIKKVVGHKQRMDKTPDRWKASVEAGLKMMRDCGVQLEFYDGCIGDCTPIIVNGELWQP